MSIRFLQTVLSGETCLYSRQISHVKPLDGGGADPYCNFYAPPLQIAHLSLV
jgi:hypothetical protein